MKRRDFFKTSASGVVAAGLLPMTGKLAKDENIDRSHDKWYRVGEGRMDIPVREKELQADVAVIGGGMAGICAAVAAARNGAKTILVHDRPVLGGNASSEIRVTVNGVQSLQRTEPVERETGIIEEILIENKFYNPQESYPVWDHVLYNFVVREPNLTLLLNTQALEAITKGNRIQTARCWQLTTETEILIHARQFIDSSGDGLLAATAGAEYRTGREGKAEFGETYAPDKPDGWVMGDCIMMISKDMGRPVPFRAPDYAIPFKADEAFKDKHRRIRQLKEGFWWIEVGSNNDIIAEREDIRHKLMAYFYGVWDYIKNSGEFPEAENLALDWVGALPGRRESRRFMGDHILSETDLTGYRHFEDAVAYGGWSLDEHCPGGIENLAEPASYFHQRFMQPYEIPYRSLYSRNIENLSLAGRNVSVTHIALSSTRIISTCALMGQAVGTGAALCVRKKVNPRDVAEKYIAELQEQLLRDDVFIPNRPAADPLNLARKARLSASSTSSGEVNNLVDGISRDLPSEIHHWQAQGESAELRLDWEKPVKLSSVEIKGDTDVHKKIMMHKNPAKNKGQHTTVPPELVHTVSVEVLRDGTWKEVARKEENLHRAIKLIFPATTASSVRIVVHKTWGASRVRLYEVRCYA